MMEQMLSQELKAEDILDIFIEQHRLCSHFDPEADPNINLSSDSTLDDWWEANNLLPWKPLSEYLNKEFQISVTEKDWKSVLNTNDKCLLMDVCELISNHCSKDNIKPINLLGKQCLTASVFLTLKKYLKQRQVDVSEIKPSTLLAPYFEKYFSEMIEQITIISNGRKVIEQIEIKKEKERLFLLYKYL